MYICMQYIHTFLKKIKARQILHYLHQVIFKAYRDMVAFVLDISVKTDQDEHSSGYTNLYLKE